MSVDVAGASTGSLARCLRTSIKHNCFFFTFFIFFIIIILLIIVIIFFRPYVGLIIVVSLYMSCNGVFLLLVNLLITFTHSTVVCFLNCHWLSHSNHI